MRNRLLLLFVPIMFMLTIIIAVIIADDADTAIARIAIIPTWQKDMHLFMLDENMTLHHQTGVWSLSENIYKHGFIEKAQEVNITALSHNDQNDIMSLLDQLIETSNEAMLLDGCYVIIGYEEKIFKMDYYSKNAQLLREIAEKAIMLSGTVIKGL